VTFLCQALYISEPPRTYSFLSIPFPPKRICYFVKYGTRIGQGWIRIRLDNDEKSHKAIFA
jgi:hypothetical protein